MRPIDIKTSNREIYMKLPSLNYQKEIIFSSNVPLNGIKRIINNINKRVGDNLEVFPIKDRYVIINKGGDLNLNVYFMMKKL